MNHIHYLNKYLVKALNTGTDKATLNAELDTLIKQFPHLEQTLRQSPLVAQCRSC